jgi:hypothetical protein
MWNLSIFWQKLNEFKTIHITTYEELLNPPWFKGSFAGVNKEG